MGKETLIGIVKGFCLVLGFLVLLVLSMKMVAPELFEAFGKSPIERAVILKKAAIEHRWDETYPARLENLANAYIDAEEYEKAIIANKEAASLNEKYAYNFSEKIEKAKRAKLEK